MDAPSVDIELVGSFLSSYKFASGHITKETIRRLGEALRLYKSNGKIP